MTYQECLKYGTRTLTEAGVPDAALDAWLLLSHVSELTRARYFMDQTRQAEPETERAYRKLIAERAKRIPLQHLTGETGFMGLPFVVNDQVLVPRPDTETLVERVLTFCRQRKAGQEPPRILDMCTGSGCIAVSLVKLGGFPVTAADISPEALDVAKENALRNACGEIVFVRSDLFSALGETQFDVIVSNPPYIPTAEIDGLMPEVRDHDPRLALDGHEDGLYFYRRLAAECPAHLTPGGRVFWEIGWNQGEAVRALLGKAGFTAVEVIQDDAGLDRVITGEWKCLTN